LTIATELIGAPSGAVASRLESLEAPISGTMCFKSASFCPPHRGRPHRLL